MNSLRPNTSKIGTRKGITANKYERTFKRGSLMFIEGDTSTEMYIIKSGKVRILKQEGDSTIELAILGAGSVLGELSLLDHQPRGATAQVIEDMSTTVIDEDLLQRTLKMIPSWLTNILNLVVKRLRDTMKKTSDDIVSKNIAGVIKIILLLYSESSSKESKPLYLNSVKDRVYATIGLGSIETENVFLHLILKELLLIRKNDLGQENIVIQDPEVLKMYLNYLRAKQRGGTVLGEKLSLASVDMLRDITAAGEKSGKKIQQNIFKVGEAQVELELERQGKGRHMNLDALDELHGAKIILKEEDVTESKYGSHKRSTLIYNLDTINRILKLHQWIDIFKEHVQF